MTMAVANILAQLQSPDRVGRDLSLLRSRVYRFSNDLRWNALAESLEEHFLAGRQPQPATLTAVRASLDQIRRDGSTPVFQDYLAEAEDIEVNAALARRVPHMWQQVPSAAPPARVVIIVGAPRSGTSHLFNLLAATGRFAYLTTVSCWAWPTWNLRQPGRRLFADVGAEVLKVDNKRTRIIPGLIMPGEAEDIWHRAVPVYRHLHGHRYEIGSEVGIGDLGILRAATHAHLAHFQCALLLAKSPFNVFRIPQIEKLWGDAVRYIHIVRDQHEVADSMRRNRFEFVVGGRLLAAEEAWTRFVGSVQQHAPADRTTTISHEQLMTNPEQAVDSVMHAI
jgi:Sulfotransferase family